jgi:hypothetical protein
MGKGVQPQVRPIGELRHRRHPVFVDLEGRPVPGVTGVSRAARPSNQDIPVANSKTDSEGLMTLAVPEGEPYFVNLILADGVWLPSLSAEDT